MQQVSFAVTSSLAISFPLAHWPQPTCDACFSSSLKQTLDLTSLIPRQRKDTKKSLCVCVCVFGSHFFCSFYLNCCGVKCSFSSASFFFPSPICFISSRSLFSEGVVLPLVKTRHFSILPLHNKRLEIRSKRNLHCEYVIKLTRVQHARQEQKDASKGERITESPTASLCAFTGKTVFKDRRSTCAALQYLF